MHRPAVLWVAASALVLAVTLVGLDARQEREYRRLMADGDRALAAGQTSEAIESFSGALALKPDSTSARLKRGDTYLRRGEFDSAVRDLGQAVALDPTAVRALERLGDAHVAAGRPGPAAEHYRRYLEIDDRAPRVEYKLGVALYQAGRHAEAVVALDRAVAADDGFALAHYALGLGLRARGPDDARAERALLRAVALDGTLAAARDTLVTMYETSGRRQAALDQLEALAALQPTRPERLVAVGLAHARLGRQDRAVLTLARAAERHPDSPAVLAALGRVWLDAALADGGGDALDAVALEKALEALAPAASRPDADGTVLALYGRALYLADRAADAERTLERAVTRLPVEPRAFAHLAEAADRLGHAARADEARARYAALAAR
jgi:tetratricopeptide (TPR) repeat protein